MGMVCREISENAIAAHSSRSSADKMHDLEPVAVVQLRVWPLIARHDRAVELDGDPVRLHSEVIDQRGQGAVWRRLAFPIDHKVHQLIFSAAKQEEQAA